MPLVFFNIATDKALDVEKRIWRLQQTSNRRLCLSRMMSVIFESKNMDETCSLTNKATGLILDVKSGKEKNRANIQDRIASGANAQCVRLA